MSEDDLWLTRQQRDFNLATYRWFEKRQPQKYTFTDTQMSIAIRSLQKREKNG